MNQVLRLWWEEQDELRVIGVYYASCGVILVAELRRVISVIFILIGLLSLGNLGMNETAVALDLSSLNDLHASPLSFEADQREFDFNKLRAEQYRFIYYYGELFYDSLYVINYDSKLKFDN